MNRILLTLALVILSGAGLAAKDYSLASPDGRINVTVSLGQDMKWAVSYDGEQILNPSAIALEVNGQKTAFGVAPKSPRVKRATVNQTLTATVPLKFKEVRDHYNEMKLSFRGWAVVFRAYDNGVAYRFETSLGKKPVQVKSETADYNFAEDCMAYWAPEKSPEFISHCEANFQLMPLSKTVREVYTFLPLSLSTSKGTRVVISETDLLDYPNMYLFGGDGTALTAEYPKVIRKTEMRTDRDVNVIEKADYIAETDGTRTFPWRIMAIGDDRMLLENCLAWQLASPEVEGDKSWIKPGKISWEWWAMINVYGVDFKAGVNTETYKYYIDFAAEKGLEYILLDEGWSASTMDITHSKPDLDLQGLINYGKEKGVGVVLWTLWTPMMADMENILDVYEDWGVAGIKIDFMQMTDQNMVNFYEDVARECFERKMVVDYHGSFKPAGLHRKYPNVMSYEGVYGMEHNKCSYDITPEHDLVLPFTRMFAGPMDYTPGATINATKDDFAMRWYHPMSQGTRAHQAAIFIVYESSVQMLCDSPSNYYKVPEYTDFIASIPTAWDETRAIEAKAGDYLLIARRKGDIWYVAGLNDWNARELSLTLDFLGEGEYEADIFRDGVNANSWAEDFSCGKIKVKAGETLPVNMANGGGWAAIIRPCTK